MLLIAVSEIEHPPFPPPNKEFFFFFFFKFDVFLEKNQKNHINHILSPMLYGFYFKLESVLGSFFNWSILWVRVFEKNLTQGTSDSGLVGRVA